MSSVNFKLFEEFCAQFPETSEEAKLAIKKMLKIEEKIECKGIKVDKSKCTLPAKENGYCGKHNPDKKVVKEVESDSEEAKPKAKAAPKKKVVKEVESGSDSEEAKPKAKASPKKKVVKAESDEEEAKPKTKAAPKKKVVDEDSEEVKPKVKSPPKKKVVEQECNFTNPTTHVKCSHAGTVKPEGAAFHYCKRHSEKSAEIEKNLDEKIEEEEEVTIDDNEFE